VFGENGVGFLNLGATQTTQQPTPTIFGTSFEANVLNWILFFVGFGFIWMWFF